MTEDGNSKLQACQFRFARPTDKLDEVVRFYKEAIGLVEIGSFNNHDGYDGIMLGLPGTTHHLEFTHHVDGSPCPAPTRDNLLVLYFDTEEKYNAAIDRMTSHGIEPVTPENPYWEGKSMTFEDPDGWSVVLFNGVLK